MSTTSPNSDAVDNTRPGATALRRFALSPIATLAVWRVVSGVVGREVILPTPERTAVEIYHIVISPEFFVVFGTSLGRVIVSFGLALGAAVVLGLCAGLCRAVDELLHTPVTVMRSVPTMGVILLSLIWLDSEGAPILVCGLVTFPIMYSAMVAAIRAVDRQLVEMHDVFRVRFNRRLLHFYIPAVTPQLRAGMAAALGLNVKVMIAAEVLSQPRTAIGTMFQIERSRLNTPGVFAWCALVIALAASLDALLDRATRIVELPDNSRTRRRRQRV